MNRKTIAVVTMTIFTSEILWQIYKKYKSYRNRKNHKDLKKCNNQKAIMEVLFFSEDSALCRTHLSNRTPCNKPNCAVGYLNKIADYLNSATESLDICMYFLTCQYLSLPIINAFRRGVNVRIIMDLTMSENSDCQTFSLKKVGIKIRMKRIYAYMHHKFAIVDNKILISGSTNWTMNALFGNYDNILITNQQTLVKTFVDEFERLWSIFDAPTQQT